MVPTKFDMASATVPKEKISSGAENENFVQQSRKFEHFKCGNQKLNGDRLQS